jgi:hypothetical protein
MKKFLNIHEHSIEFLDSRFYPVETENGTIYYPSVTTVLDLYPKGAAFAQWLKDVGNSAGLIADRAAESGSKVHDGIERLIKGEEIEWDDKEYSLDEWNGLLRFKDFYERFNPKVISCESMVYSHEKKYAGMCDLVCEFNGQRWLLDNKFSNNIWVTYHMQVAAYKSAWEEIHPNLPIDSCGILWLKAQTRTEGRKGSIQGVGWKIEVTDNVDRMYEMFLKTLDIYYFENPDPKPKNIELPSKIKL